MFWGREPWPSGYEIGLEKSRREFESRQGLSFSLWDAVQNPTG